MNLANVFGLIFWLGAAAAAAAAAKQNAPYYRTTVGDFSVTVISDLISDGAKHEIVLEQIFQDQPPEAFEAIKKDNGIEKVFQWNYNVVHVDTGSHRVLIDAGYQDEPGGNVGRLLENMAEAGLDPLAVDRVLFTHAHVDHMPGVMKSDGSEAFPNAEYFIGRIEYEFWQDILDKDDGSGVAFWRSVVDGARKSFDLIGDRLSLFEFGDEVVPGITSKGMVGHTPGHSGYVLRNGEEVCIIVGDAIVLDMISVPHPDWVHSFDFDHTSASNTRKSILEEVANQQTRLILFHGDFPGIGRIITTDEGHEFRKDRY